METVNNNKLIHNNQEFLDAILPYIWTITSPLNQATKCRFNIKYDILLLGIGPYLNHLKCKDRFVEHKK